MGGRRCWCGSGHMVVTFRPGSGGWCTRWIWIYLFLSFHSRQELSIVLLFSIFWVDSLILFPFLFSTSHTLASPEFLLVFISIPLRLFVFLCFPSVSLHTFPLSFILASLSCIFSLVPAPFFNSFYPLSCLSFPHPILFPSCLRSSVSSPQSLSISTCLYLF